MEIHGEGDKITTLRGENIWSPSARGPLATPKLRSMASGSWIQISSPASIRLPKEIIVVGAGVVGLEYASFMAALGAHVTLIDQRPQILDFVDREIVEALAYHLRQMGTTFRLGEKVTRVGIDPDTIAFSPSLKAEKTSMPTCFFMR